MTTSEKKREYNKRHREKQAQKKEIIENLKIEKKHIIPKFEFSEISENSENFEISKKNIKLPKQKISENSEKNENSENFENPKNDFFQKATPKVTPIVSKTIEFSQEISQNMPEENIENLNENFTENSDDYVLDKKTYLTLLELAKKGREAPKNESSKVQVENVEKIQKVENEQSFFFQFKNKILAGLAPMLAIQGFMMVGTQLYPKLTKPSPLSNTLNRQEEPAMNSQNGYTVRTSNWA
jgi:hypothetical protein